MTAAEPVKRSAPVARPDAERTENDRFQDWLAVGSLIHVILLCAILVIFRDYCVVPSLLGGHTIMAAVGFLLRSALSRRLGMVLLSIGFVPSIPLTLWATRWLLG
jgi:hypothetical protein